MNKIYLEGTHNTRDLGGYLSQDGRIVKSGILYRSDKLSNLTSKDVLTLQKLGIKRIIDFRSEDEKTRDPNIIPEGVEYVEMPIEADKKIKQEIYDVLSGKIDKDIKEFLMEANRQFIYEYSETFKLFLLKIINNPVPTLYHCTAGKDRTGFATLLIYTILGIDRETILEDYLKTNEFIADSIEKVKFEVAESMKISNEEVDRIMPLLKVDIDYINSAINEADKKYGSIFTFINDKLEIKSRGRDLLKGILLE
jgi:protein-tyrosine phosphatase